MKLSNFIEEKTKELLLTNREAIFKYAVDVELSKNSVSEMFTASNTPLDREVIELETLSELPEKNGIEHTPNGSKVVFEVKRPRKRKYESVSFDVLWSDNNG
ncbi:hypothetical protein [Priestia flexa]|uniref:hypothetical protein n=1 Tax=Priestia flexa TaxID=86664 RepID=UPI0004737999|nr:hypothetical protein [Priestia flexa]